MAWLEQRGATFHISFRFGEQRFKRSLKTTDEREANELAGRLERRLRLVEQGDLSVPEDVDFCDFLLSNGKPKRQSNVPRRLTLSALVDQYLENLPEESIEANSLYTIRIHLNHFLTELGSRLDVRRLSLSDLQGYVDARSRQKGQRSRPISPTTIKKELASLSGVWSWAQQTGLVQGPLPKQGLRFPKSNEKPPFQTWAEIERQIARGGLTEQDERELWDCLFLTDREIEEVLAFVKEVAWHPFIYPMIVMAAHTGARRSELVRSQVQDFNFEANTVLLREKKRVKGKRSTRSVPLSTLLRSVMDEWLNQAEGPSTFTNGGTALSVDEATHHFKHTFAGSRWAKLRGWHVFRHSFISNCAARGIDQRIIDAWAGHQTEEMRRRYTHLFPDSQQAAMHSVFGR